MNRYSLCDISLGQKAVIYEIKAASRLKRRLLDIGFVKNTPLECVGISPLGDPKAFYIRGSVIALRSEDSKDISVILP